MVTGYENEVNNAEVIGGVPLVSVIGTPRTMGERLGSRLKPRLQVLAQYLSEQLCSLAQASGHNLTATKLKHIIEPSALVISRHEPGLWMEIEAMSQASEVSISDLLLIHGYGDLLSYFQCQVPPLPSTYICLDGAHTSCKQGLMALCWYVDPALLPYLTLLRRIPNHGPVTLSLTIAGLHHVAGLSEAGLAVAANELRVRDGTSGVFTTHILASMLTAPSIDDALRRGSAAPRHGGAAVHGLAGNGERFSLELSGQNTVRLNDPLLNAPRVHTNHALDERIIPAVSLSDSTSKLRLEQTASLTLATDGITPSTIASWFAFNPEVKHGTRIIESDTERIPLSAVLMVLNPSTREIHLARSGRPGGLETIKL
jgi:hypothetical protein